MFNLLSQSCTELNHNMLSQSDVEPTIQQTDLTCCGSIVLVTSTLN